jgi:hypothetical protein
MAVARGAAERAQTTRRVPPPPPVVRPVSPYQVPVTRYAPATVPPAAIPPAAPAGGGGRDLRGTTVGIGTSGVGRQAEDALSKAMAGLGTSVNINYTPVGGPNFGAANNYLNQAAGAAGGIRVAGVSGPALSNTGATQSLINQARGGYGASANEQELQRMAMAQIKGLDTAPNRADLAARALALQRDMTNPAWQADLRHAGQQAAALGRIGAGMTTTELNDITLAREKALGQYGQQAALEAAALEMQDRLARVGATTGYQGQLASTGIARAGGLAGLANTQYGVDTTGFREGMDRAGLSLQSQVAQANAAAGRAGLFQNLGSTSAGMASSAASHRAGQAAQALDAQLKQQALRQALVGQYADIQGQQFGQGATRANLATQQQGRQDALAQAGIDNRVRQAMVEDQLLNSQFGRQLQGATAAGHLGYGNDPYQMQLAAAAQQQAAAQGQRSQVEQAAQAAAMAKALGGAIW